MKNSLVKSFLVLALLAFGTACSPEKFESQSVKSTESQVETSAAAEQNEMDELNPFDPNIEEKLNQMDAAYSAETGMSPFLEADSNILSGAANCKKLTCAVYALVKKSEQRMYLYENGKLLHTWKTSTGTASHGTPNFEGRPNGRIYDKYTSTKYPGGDYNGLGNMPYAIFYKGGFAIHGTGKGNWPKLGSPASHGCTRIHPDNAFIFNRMVRKYGIGNVWISITQ